MAVSASTVEPASSSEARSTAALAIGLSLLTFGMMFTFVGAILSGICLIEAGAVCQGTGIGSIGFTMLAIGVPMALIGIPLFARGRKALGDRTRTQIARQVEGGTNSVVGEDPVARTECPHCGAPAPPGAPMCEFCGGYLPQ